MIQNLGPGFRRGARVAEMAITAGFADFVTELLQGLGPVSIRRMFGAGGVYADDVLFGVIDEDVLYLKADEALRAELAAAGSGPAIIHSKDGRPMELGFWRLPEEALDEPDLA